jgi:hypothetical protein
MNDIYLYYDNKIEEPINLMPFDENTLSAPFWDNLEALYCIVFLNFTDNNNLITGRSYYESTVTNFARRYQISRDGVRLLI